MSCSWTGSGPSGPRGDAIVGNVGVDGGEVALERIAEGADQFRGVSALAAARPDA